MTSQSWQDTTWKHQLFIYKPAVIRSDSQALLLVDGGAWKPELEAPAKEGEDLPGNAKILLTAADMLQARSSSSAKCRSNRYSMIFTKTRSSRSHS